jgi:tetratricopeptide (TPR) repeat protein
MIRSIAKLLLGAFLCAACLVGPAPAQDEPPAVTVLMTDGRKLEGQLVSEDANGIVLRMKLGADVPIAKGDIKEIVRAAAKGEGGAGEGDEGGGAVEETVLSLRDGAVIRGRGTDRGTYWEIENDLGTTRVEKSLVRSTRTEKVARGAAPQAPVDRDEVRDLGLGFEVSRPSPEWHFAEQSPDPLARVVMRRQGPVVVFRAALAEPLPADLAAVEPANQEKVQQLVLKDLKDRWKAVRAFAFALDRYRGVPVWRATYQADSRVFGSKFSFREIHIVRGEGHYVLQAYTPADQEKDALSHMDAALQSFSWLGPVADLGSEYLNYGLGIRIARPRAEWRLATRLFDREVPVEVLSPDGSGRYRLEVAPAAGISTPQAAADALEKELGAKSRLFRRVARTEKNLSGVPAVDLKYQDAEGGKKLVDVRRLILVREQKLIEFVAAQPASEGAGGAAFAAAPMADALFEGVDALVEESAGGLYKRGARAVELRVVGEKKLDEARDAAGAIPILSQAIDLAPAYGQCYLLRGKAYSDTGDFKKAMKDYDAAGDLIEDPALGKLVATAEVEQAKRLAKDDFNEARKLFLGAIRNDPNTRSYKEDLSRATFEYVRVLTQQGKYEPAVEELKEADRRFPEDTRYKREAIRVYGEWGRKLHQDGELYKARVVLRRGLKIDPDNATLKAELDRVEADIKKKEEGDSKKGTKKK